MEKQNGGSGLLALLFLNLKKLDLFLGLKKPLTGFKMSVRLHPVFFMDLILDWGESEYEKTEWQWLPHQNHHL